METPLTEPRTLDPDFIEHERTHLTSIMAIAMSQSTEHPTLVGMVRSALLGTWVYAQKAQAKKIELLEAEVQRLKAKCNE